VHPNTAVNLVKFQNSFFLIPNLLAVVTHFVDIGGPIAVAGVGVEEESRGAGASHSAARAGALQEHGAVTLDGDDLASGGALAGFRLGWSGAGSLRGSWAAGGVGSGSAGDVGLGGFDGDFAVEEDVDDGGEKRIFALPAERALEVVEIQSPDHTAGKTLILDVLGLDANSFGVIVGDPLISTISIHHFVLGMILGGPAILNVLADFVVRNESLFTGVSSGSARAFSRSSHAGLRFVGQSESSAVSAQSHDELVGGKSQLHEVVDGPIDVQETVVSGLVGARVQRDVSTSVLLPGSVEIVGHEVDKVHFFGEFGDFVSRVNRRFTTTNGGGQEEALFTTGRGFGIESGSEFLDEDSECLFVFWF